MTSSGDAGSGGPGRGRGWPRSLELGLFVWWAYAILHGFYLANPMRRDVLATLFAPALPPTGFAWAHVRAVGARLAIGHMAVAAVMAAAGGAGAMILTFLRVHPPGVGEWRLFAVLLGLAGAMLGWLAAGLTGLWAPSLACAACAAGIAALPAARRPAAPAPVVSTDRIGGGWRMALTIEIVVAGLLLAWALVTPERFYDAQVYHLAVPSLFVMQHKVTALPHLMHASFPLGMHMVYGWLWMLGGEPAARAWRLWVFGGVIWLIVRLGAREGRPAVGLTAAALFAVCPVFLLNACMTSVDVEMCLFIPAACLAALESRRHPEHPGWIVLAGALIGAAYATKITTVFWLPWIAVAVGGRGVRRWSLFLGAAACWAVPWFVRNLAAVGNPVYPYLTGVFAGGRQWDPDKHLRFLQQQSTYVIKAWHDLPRLPWLLNTGANSETFIGPALLLLVPFVLLRRPVAPAARLYGAVGGLAVLLWIGLTHVHRFLLPTWALLGLAAAWALWDLDAGRRWHRRAGLAVVLAAGAANLAWAGVLIRLNLDPADLIAGRESPEEYLGRRMLNPYTAVAAPAVSRLTMHDRVFMVGETRGLYWPAPFRNHSVYDVEAFEQAVRCSRTGADAARHLRQAGATHLFVNDRETARMKFRFDYPLLVLAPADLAVVTELWRGWVDLVAEGGAHAALYRLRSSPRAGPDAPALPLSFNSTALRNEFEGVTQITWTGGGQIAVKKEATQ